MTQRPAQRFCPCEVQRLRPWVSAALPLKSHCFNW